MIVIVFVGSLLAISNLAFYQGRQSGFNDSGRKNKDALGGDRINAVVNSVKSGIEYSASPCWLDPAWGLTTANETCVPKNATLGNTSASGLTCDDKPNNFQRSSHGLTVVLLYYAKPAMLMSQFEIFAKYPEEIRSQMTLLLIDDGSPDGLRAMDYIANTNYNLLFRIRVARITVDKAWNIGGARNLAFHLVDTRRVLLLDIDITVPEETMRQVVTWQVRNGDYSLAHRFIRLRPGGKRSLHPAVTLIDVESYWQSGGCDEDFVGHYGFTDVHFWYRWRKDPFRQMLDQAGAPVLEIEDQDCYSSHFSNEQIAFCNARLSNLTKPKKNNARNKKLAKKKFAKGCWSNKYLRFTWILEQDPI